MKKTAIFKTAVLALVVGVGLHFVPVYSRTGYLDTALNLKPGEVNSSLCIGYLRPVDDNYRFIPNGINGFNDARHILVPKNSGCDRWVHLRFYIF